MSVLKFLYEVCLDYKLILNADAPFLSKDLSFRDFYARIREQNDFQTDEIYFQLSNKYLISISFGPDYESDDEMSTIIDSECFYEQDIYSYVIRMCTDEERDEIVNDILESNTKMVYYINDFKKLVERVF
jgi:hypothetical protein